MDLMNLFFVYQWYVTIDEDDNAVDNIIDDDVEWMKDTYCRDRGQGSFVKYCESSTAFHWL